MDADAHALLEPVSRGTPWRLPNDYSIYPAPDSRLADPTDPDFPRLPSPGPILYSDSTKQAAGGAESLPSINDEVLPEPLTLPDGDAARELQRLPRLILAPQSGRHRVQLAMYRENENETWTPPTDEYGDSTTELAIQPIPASYWRVLPDLCLRYMLEFESVDAEYAKTFHEKAEDARVAPQQRLSLAQIIDLAVTNSREYQTEKERLYVAALSVSLQRYDYQLKFTPQGNGGDAVYNFDRSNGFNTTNRLSFPNAWTLERTMARGGNLVAQFANDVVLDFNGSQLMSSRVGSDLLFSFTQSVLQRDILLDPLIQSERNLVYAARDFARFRKEFFFDIAQQYYSLLSTYRRVEIDSQNYFSLVRTVEQARAEVRAAVKTAPNQVAVDQFEQSMLAGQSSLIQTSNGLDRSLDTLKISIGLPTDYPVDLDLAELDRLKLLDEIEVAVERVTRWSDRVQEQFDRRPLQRADIVNAGIYMIERMFDWNELVRTYDGQSKNLSEIKEIYARLRLEQARDEVERHQIEYDEVTRTGTQEPTILVFLRATVLLDANLRLMDQQLAQLVSHQVLPPQQLAQLRDAWSAGVKSLNLSRDALGQNPSDDELVEILDQLRPNLDQVGRLVISMDRELQYDRDRPPAVRDQQILDEIARLLNVSQQTLSASGSGLPEVNIDVNDAMLTALIQRLDLMNERGFLADDWRRIKFAADDLRSVMNLSARHRLSTDDHRDRPFEFDLDDSSTELRLSLDLPLNRRLQRNDYRRSLINYQQGRRTLMALEDDIKFEIRNGLRNLNLTRVQYPISVTQAALAAEQVISIRLQLALGTPNVRGTDLLEALQRSREALTSVANSRILYLVDRAEFVLNLELMQLNENGFWPQINDPNYQPEANLVYPMTAGPTYGMIPPYVKPSKIMYHLYCHRVPGEMVEVVSDPAHSPIDDSETLADRIPD